MTSIQLISLPWSLAWLTSKVNFRIYENSELKPLLDAANEEKKSEEEGS